MKTNSQTAMFGFFICKNLTIFICIMTRIYFQKNYICKTNLKLPQKIHKLFFMKKYFFILFLLASFSIFGLTPKKNFNQDREKKILELVLKTLQESHYKSISINDDLSKIIFNNYIEALDKQKVFFLESDFLEFKKIETKLDDQIKNNDLSFFYLTYERVIKRMVEAKVIYTDVSKSIFKIDKKESINIDFAKYKYCKNETELKNRWRSIYKLELINKIYKKEKEADLKSTEVLEKESRIEILDDTNSTKTNYQNFKRANCFEIYINAIIKSFDSNSIYLYANNKDKFDVNQGGRLVGIGAQIELNSGFIKIKKIAYKSPAYDSKQIEEGDIVLKLGQENEDPIDVVGSSIEEATKLIKGKIGTSLKLTIKKSDGTILVVKLKREIVDINDSNSKSLIVEKNGKNYGIINIPVFYNDLNKESLRDAAKDVADEILNLKKEGIEGLLLDLRNNNSDSLETGFTICGYFLGNNPITQIKNQDNSVGILKTEDANMLWDGPLVVLLNEESSKTTEVFAAAIQDYKRGIIIGNIKSKGDGTVIKTIELSPDISKDKKENLGFFKIATQKYYRISGNTFEEYGVNSDIVVSNFDNNKPKYDKTKVETDKINPIVFSQFNSIKNLNEVIFNAKKRIANNKNLKLIDDEKVFKSRIELNNQFSLNYKNFKSQEIRNFEQSKKFNVLDNYKSLLRFNYTNSDINLLKKNQSLLEKRNQWLEHLKKDVCLEEAIDVLSEIKSN